MSTLYDVLQAKVDDVEIVLQLVYLFYKILYYPQSRKAIINHERLVTCILDMVIDPCEDIRRFANLCVDIILEASDDWKDRVLERRFMICNHYWLLFLEGGAEALMRDDHEELPEETSEDYFHQEHPYLGAEFGADWDMQQNMYSLKDYDDYNEINGYNFMDSSSMYDE